MESRVRSEASFGIIPLRHLNGKWEVLLVHNKSGNHWAFPKGHAEAGETELQSAFRELGEETGLHVVDMLREEPFEEQYLIERSGEPTLKTVKYWPALVAGDLVPQEIEIHAAVWLPLDQVTERVSHPEGKRISEALIEYLI